MAVAGVAENQQDICYYRKKKPPEERGAQNQQGKESGLADDDFVVVYLPNSIKVKVPKDKLKYCLTTSPYGIIRYDYEAVKRYGIIQ